VGSGRPCSAATRDSIERGADWFRSLRNREFSSRGRSHSLVTRASFSKAFRIHRAPLRCRLWARLFSALPWSTGWPGTCFFTPDTGWGHEELPYSVVHDGKVVRRGKTAFRRNARHCVRFAPSSESNSAENSMRPVVLGRKNWIHVGSEQAGPKVAAVLSVVDRLRCGWPYAYERRCRCIYRFVS